jgi:hypothetical protein
VNDQHDRREAHEKAASIARHQVLSAVIHIVRQTGGKVVLRPVIRSMPDSGSMTDVEAAAGLTAARHVELAALRFAKDYIRHAREDGRTWHEIGIALGLGTHARNNYIPVAEAAYDHAAGRAGDELAQAIGRVFVWVCPVCDEVVGDRGPHNGPADDEAGHATGCPRLAAAIAAWREAGPGADSR